MKWVFAGLGIALSAAGESGPGLDRLLRYAQDLCRVRSLHMDFNSITRDRGGSISKRSGHSDLDLQSGDIFLQVEEETDGRRDGLRRISWKDGIMSEEIVPAIAVVPCGRISGSPHPYLSFTSLPSEHPLYLEKQPLAVVLRHHEVMEMLNEGDGAIAGVLLRPRRGGPQGDCPEYLIDVSPDPGFPIVSVKSFLRQTSPHDSSLAKPNMRLPCEGGYAFVAALWRIERYEMVEGIPLPTRWTFGKPVLLPELQVELEITKLGVNSRPAHGYVMDWSPGTRVVDEFTGEVSQVGAEDIAGESTSEAVLDKIASEAGCQLTAKEPDRSPLPSACAANALYSVCRLTGREVPLRSILLEMGIGSESEDRDVSVEGLCRVAESFGLLPVAVRGGAELLTEPTRAPVIAHARGRKGLWHYAVVHGYVAETGELRVLDMPFRPFRVALGRFLSDWSGVAVLFDSEDLECARAAARRKKVLWAIGLAFAASALSLFACAAWRYRKKKRMLQQREHAA